MRRLKFTAYVVAALLLAGQVFLLSGCSARKTYAPTPEGEFEAAYAAYESHKYPNAIDRFKQLVYKYPGSDLVEQARFYLGDSYFLNGEYLLAANEFERLAREFPQGRFADVSLYKCGLSYKKMSRRPERDQTETTKALETLETLLAKYPNTKYADSVRVAVRSLKDRLAEKELVSALFYFKRNLYDSSIIYLKSVLENYPECSLMPSVLYHLYLASTKMGYPDDARDAKDQLCRNYADSQYGRQICGQAASAPADSSSGKTGGKSSSN